jgi:hypothetical protein
MTTGFKDIDGFEIMEGSTVQHNKNTYIVKYSDNQKVLVLRIVNDTGMNWRSMEWLSRVAKYCKVIK